MNALHKIRAAGEAARQLISRIELVELTPAVLDRARKPFPVAVRTLDALHLATAQYLRGLEHDISLASYDRRMLAAARALRIALHEI